MAHPFAFRNSTTTNKQATCQHGNPYEKQSLAEECPVGRQVKNAIRRRRR